MVLVHCFMGISRSSTLAAAHILHTERPVPRVCELLDRLRNQRRWIWPNDGFVEQLRFYAFILEAPPSVLATITNYVALA